jgi:hypothetical protein
MATCEAFEIEISAMIDGQLPAAEALPVIDHICGCRSCRGFYRMVRGLEASLAEARVSSGRGELPAGLWARIDAELQEDGVAGEVVSLPQAAHSLPGWLWKMAAAILVLVGTIVIGRQMLPANDGPPSDVLMVRMESDRGQMSDQRFIELTTELLRADRRYHQKMSDILQAVGGHAYVAEGSPDRSREIQGDDDRISNRPAAPGVGAGAVPTW